MLIISHHCLSCPIYPMSIPSATSPSLLTSESQQFRMPNNVTVAAPMDIARRWGVGGRTDALSGLGPCGQKVPAECESLRYFRTRGLRTCAGTSRKQIIDDKACLFITAHLLLAWSERSQIKNGSYQNCNGPLKSELGLICVDSSARFVISNLRWARQSLE